MFFNNVYTFYYQKTTMCMISYVCLGAEFAIYQLRRLLSNLNLLAFCSLCNYTLAICSETIEISMSETNLVFY